MLEICLQADVDDFEFVGGDSDAEFDLVFTESSSLKLLTTALDAQNVAFVGGDLCYKPQAPLEVAEEAFEQNMDLIDALNDLEDVDLVEHNMLN